MTSKIFACSMLLATLAATGAAQDGPPTGAGVNPVVVKIDGQPIRAAEVSLVMLNLQAQLKGSGRQVEPKVLMEQATQRVIEQRLLAREARRLGLAPEPARVEQMLAAADQQAGGREQLDANLAAAGTSRTELARMVEDLELSRALIAQQIAPSIAVSDGDARTFYDEYPAFFQRGETTAPFDEVADQAGALARQKKTAEAVRGLLERLSKAATIEFTQG